MTSKVTPPHKAETDVMDTVNIALCFNNNFCQLAAGAIESIASHITTGHKYNISIIHDDITDQNQLLLKGICNKSNVSVGFITFNPEKEAGKELFIRGHFSKETYSRLFLHKIFPKIDRILFTDVDVIVNSDLAELYKIDLGDFPIAATGGSAGYTSFDHSTVCTKDDLVKVTWVKNSEFSQYQNMYEYVTGHLKFSEQDIKTYFTVGTMVIDLKKYGKIIDKGLQEIIGNKYVLPDLDILNILFRRNALILDLKYCVHPRRMFEYISKFGKLPDIIHYYGALKPNKSMSRLGDNEYWKSISQTSFYYPVLESFIDNKLQHTASQFQGILNDQKTLEDLYHNLRRIRRLNMRRKFIRIILKVLVDTKKYKKLKSSPDRFFEDSKSGFIRYLKKFYL